MLTEAKRFEEDKKIITHAFSDASKGRSMGEGWKLPDETARDFIRHVWRYGFDGVRILNDIVQRPNGELSKHLEKQVDEHELIDFIDDVKKEIRKQAQRHLEKVFLELQRDKDGMQPVAAATGAVKPRDESKGVFRLYEIKAKKVANHLSLTPENSAVKIIGTARLISIEGHDVLQIEVDSAKMG